MLPMDLNHGNYTIAHRGHQTPTVVKTHGKALLRMGSRVATVTRLVLALTLTSCATVAPYERETLSRADMELDRDEALGRAESHATEVREGASGALGAGGGGCGCN